MKMKMNNKEKNGNELRFKQGVTCTRVCVCVYLLKSQTRERKTGGWNHDEITFRDQSNISMTRSSSLILVKQTNKSITPFLDGINEQRENEWNKMC